MVSSNPSTSAATPARKSFFGHPRMLANLFSVELWERFSFYGMQGILLYYMYYSVTDGGLGIDIAVATSLVGAYGGGVYLSTIVGAWLADRVLGSERVLFYSAAIVVLGHISLAVLPGAVGLAAGLILIALGSGGVKANATSLVGTLYSQKDERRDAGFSIFYMGINLGALVGPLLTGLLQVRLGFHYGFGLAAIGMAIGLIQYGMTRKYLPEAAHQVTNPLPRSKYGVMGGVTAGAVVIISLAVIFGLLKAENLAVVMAAVAIIASIAYFVIILRSPKVGALERRRVYSFMPLFIASAAFWALFQQQFTVVALYADTSLDRRIFGWEMPPSWVQSINPIFIIIFAAVFAGVWTKLGNRQPSSPLKFALGLAVMGLAFLAFIPFSGGGPNSTPLLAIVGILLLFTFAELFISPIGLSVATKLAPEIFRTQMVALFFLSVSLGTTLAGWLAQFYDPETEVSYFMFSGITAIVIGVALAAGTPAIKKLMGGVR
ncbi:MULTISPECIES: peptide MFS transporter [Arthrobacter]|uniref:Peptide MFS transporter n=2 Tax=Arthrobacter TaxID=1663 RepID=A0A975PEL8_9MICC|nr:MULTISPECIES: peptide MFS transporter [Arthrobacter]MBO0896846.1 peptide MFS transporter [Arthrobacter sunyaminii]MBO0909329.1 peptide MFS transporter [Arthrobacter sunyaminii]MCC3266200.1 peptide MFS transporter [Arthrobacter gengyunqii]QWQ36345.1 peptide MFS transporter [Arthrobacter sunyaminii]